MDRNIRIMNSVVAASTADAAAAGGCAATATAHPLVCEILQLMDMGCKRIDYSSLNLLSDNIMRELPSCTLEVRAKTLHMVLDIFKKKNVMPTPDSLIGTKPGREGPMGGTNGRIPPCAKAATPLNS